ncbi:MAG: hypothetical protein OXG37_05355 [Actinomycetia bacterium]|nr:hypothetical protein [Actinomycetes bacterium]
MSEKHKRRRQRIEQRTLELPPSDYQPTKAELGADIGLPATPARAVMQNVEITHSG